MPTGLSSLSRAPLARLRTGVLVVPLLLIAPSARADLYVANSNSNNLTVSITRPNCGFFSGVVPAGSRPIGVAVSPDGTRAYVTNIGDGTLSVFDTSLPAIVSTVAVGGSPYGPIDVAVHPDGSRVYVISNNRLSVVNTASHTISAVVFLPGYAYDLAVHPDGSRVYVATVAGGVTVIDTATNAATGFVPVGGNPPGVAVNPAGTRLYVIAYAATGFLAVFDTATLAPVTSVPMAGVPERIAVHPSGTRVYVANNMNVEGVPHPGKLTVIDAATHAVLVTQAIDANPGGVAADRSHVYVTTADGGGSQGYVGHLWTFNGESGAFVGRVPVGSIPAGVATFVNPVPPPLPTDVEVTGIEVTQGVQDLANSVMLVAGRRTFARVHVKTDAPTTPTATATLFGVRMDCTGTTCEGEVVGSLMPANSPSPWIFVKSSPQRRRQNESFLFELPWSWTVGDPIRLLVVPHSDPWPPSGVCQADAPGLTIGFEAAATLRLQFIRLAYAIDGTNVQATVAEQNQSESWIRRTYPLTNLVSGPDWQMFFGGLGSRVDRSAEECQDMDADDRSLCAQRYITPKLALANVLSGVPGGADGAYGLLPQYTGGACVAPASGPMPCFTRGACCTDGVGAGPSDDPDYAAHEIGHLLGRHHPVQGAPICGHDAVDAAYPYVFSMIHPIPYDHATGFAGFDSGDAALAIARTPLNTYNGPYDVMGYCAPLWISDYTYRSLYAAVRGLDPAAATSLARPGADARAKAARRIAPSTAAVPGDWLAVFGSIVPGLPVPVSLDVRRVDRVARVPPRTPGTYSIRLIDAAGATLADHAFTPETLGDATPVGEASPALSFGLVVPFAPGTAEVRIVDVAGGGTVLAAKAVSASPPVVAGVTAGAPDPATGVLTLAWTATDPDGDALAFDVFFTRDGAASLQPVALGVTTTTVEVDTTTLGGGTVQLRVMATDGVLSGFADSAPLSLAAKAPRPRILTPGEGATVNSGQLVNLEGQATDAQDGVIPDEGLAWSVPGRALGTGSRLSVTDLAPGLHAITLTATNSLGLAGTASVRIVVRRETAARPALTVGPRRIGWHVAAGETQLQTDQLDIDVAGAVSLEFTAESSAPWLTVSASGVTSPATLTLTADPTGLAGGATLEGGVTVTAAGIPGESITVPVTLSVGNTFVVGNADPEVFDLCPDDPGKMRPGACGCGVAETDAGQDCATALPGVCGAGVVVCTEGRSSCVPAIEPSREVRDGLDNDCDGRTDEGTRRRRQWPPNRPPRR
jgi:YVTN family beta-propeller protein